MRKQQRGYKKRQNKVTLNVLSRRNSRRSNYRIRKTVLDFCLTGGLGATGSPDVASTSTSWEDNVSYNEDEHNVTVTSNVSAYTKQKQNLAAKWDYLRSSAYRAMVQNETLQHQQKCFVCGCGDADVRCEQCGPLYMCHNCCVKHHNQMNFHHSPEIWQVRTHVPTIHMYTCNYMLLYEIYLF